MQAGSCPLGGVGGHVTLRRLRICVEIHAIEENGESA